VSCCQAGHKVAYSVPDVVITWSLVEAGVMCFEYWLDRLTHACAVRPTLKGTVLRVCQHILSGDASSRRGKELLSCMLKSSCLFCRLACTKTLGTSMSQESCLTAT